MKRRKIIAAVMVLAFALTSLAGCDAISGGSSRRRHNSHDDDDDEVFRPSRYTEQTDASESGTESSGNTDTSAPSDPSDPSDPDATSELPGTIESSGASSTTETSSEAGTTVTGLSSSYDGLWLFPGSTPQSLYPSPFFLYITVNTIPYSFDSGDRYYYENTPCFVPSEQTASLFPELTASLYQLNQTFADDNTGWRNNEAVSSINQYIYVRRADDQVFSFVSNKSVNYGDMNLEGFNYDSATGRYITMQDIVSDWDALASLLGMSGRSDIESSGTTFVIEPTGVTFLIPDGEGGYIHSTVIYAGHENIFSMDYSFNSQLYCMDITDASASTSYTLDIGCDGIDDSFTYEPVTDDYGSIINISVTVNGQTALASENEIWAYDLTPKIVCRSADETYLLLSALGDSDWINTYIFRLSPEGSEYVGYVDGDVVGAPMAVENQYISVYSAFEGIAEGSLMADPYNIYARERTYLFGTYDVFRLLLPYDICSLQGGVSIASGATTHTILTDVQTTNYMNGEPAVLPEGTEVRIALADEDGGRSVVQDIATGTTYVIEVDDPEGYPLTVNGIAEENIMTNLLYAS